jgi:cystathionine gamma-synthase
MSAPDFVKHDLVKSDGVKPDVTRLDAATRAVRAAVDSDHAHGAVMPGIVLSSNYSFAGFAQKRRYDYTRSGNPTRDQLAHALADLEGGAGAVVTATGMAAVSLAIAPLPAGAFVVAPHDCYGGTYRLLSAWAKQGRLRVAFVDLNDARQYASVLHDRPALVWIETPSNPLLRLTDIRATCAAAHAAGALTVVDNTFLSPVRQQPLALGGDLVVHSTTKYLNGHSDVVGGAVVYGEAWLGEQLSWWANCLGITGAPFDSWLTLRGVRTLSLRMAQHEANAAALADALVRHPAVSAVHWPGLASHPQHALALRQQSGFGAMLSAELRGGIDAARVLCESLQLFTLAESLGGVESLIAHPATMTHASMDAEARRHAGIGDGLVRLSPGIEATDDLLADLAQGLEAVLQISEAAAA